MSIDTTPRTGAPEADSRRRRAGFLARATTVAAPDGRSATMRGPGTLAVTAVHDSVVTVTVPADTTARPWTAPALVLLIGAAGSGKSTPTRAHWWPERIVSRDALLRWSWGQVPHG